ncbi:MAG: hypothetical protein JWP42_4328, partial [Pseudomonas sp.]|nr:hypothetical protein [Pseudomonas sp.]
LTIGIDQLINRWLTTPIATEHLIRDRQRQGLTSPPLFNNQMNAELADA